VSNGKNLFYSKRAILRFGMLLRDSTIAQEVRTQLLNVFEQSGDGQRTEQMDEETKLILAIVKAGNDENRYVALGAYSDYKDRKQAAVEEANADLTSRNTLLDNENSAHARDVMLWSDRAILERLMQIYSGKSYWGMKYGEKAKLGWGVFYRQLHFRYRISLALRKKADDGAKGNSLDYLKDDEWPIAVRVAYSMCRDKGYDILGILSNDAVFKRIMECDGMEFADHSEQHAAVANG